MNFRKYATKSGNVIVAGKTAEQNENLLKKHVEKDDLVFHTASAGSPFCVIKKANKKDVYEAAVFCAKYSREWKKASAKKDIMVHCFKGGDIFKSKDMKTGTFGVKKFKAVRVKKEDVERL